MIVTDGSSNLIYWDPDTLQTARIVPVRDASGNPIGQLNEIEYIHGWIFANIWGDTQVVVIDPTSGVAVARLDFTPLKQESIGDVLNGLAYTMRTGPADTDVVSGTAWGGKLWVTGKKWNKMFEVELTNFIDVPLTAPER